MLDWQVATNAYNTGSAGRTNSNLIANGMLLTVESLTTRRISSRTSTGGTLQSREIHKTLDGPLDIPPAYIRIRDDACLKGGVLLRLSHCIACLLVYSLAL